MAVPKNIPSTTMHEEPAAAGNYFVSNYPPYSFWQTDREDTVQRVLDTPPAPDTPLGIYVHIPFCRRRCHFCYFKVYTGKKSSEIRRYLDGLQRELTLYASRPFLQNRRPAFVYFGGGTPSYLSVGQLRDLFGSLQELVSWRETEEITFECEPGTLSGEKLDVLRELGVTRLSLGVENFDDEILVHNGRAHRSPEIFRTYAYARSLDFPQINIDLIAGMLGETEENWHRCIDRAIELQPDIVTIYQLEIPFNTILYREASAHPDQSLPVVDWTTRRRWVTEAFQQLEANGYTITSAYSAVKAGQKSRFLYRDCLWEGGDLLGLGVASFSHVHGTHFQNQKDFLPYLETVEQDRLPLWRSLPLSEEERWIREFILQLKRGVVNRRYFQTKFQVDPAERCAQPLRALQSSGILEIDEEWIQLRREGLMRVDSLLPRFYLPHHQNARYT